MKSLLTIFLMFSCLLQISCVSAYKKMVGADQDESYAKVFRSDFNTTWLSVLDALQSFSLEMSNRESGILQTKWVENTGLKNFKESFVGTEVYQLSQYRLKVTVLAGSFQGEQAVRVRVQKEQRVQRDILEELKPVPSDGLEENTFLYRVGRTIALRKELDRMDQEKAKQVTGSVEEELDFTPEGQPSDQIDDLEEDILFEPLDEI